MSLKLRPSIPSVQRLPRISLRMDACLSSIPQLHRIKESINVLRQSSAEHSVIMAERLNLVVNSWSRVRVGLDELARICKVSISVQVVVLLNTSKPMCLILEMNTGTHCGSG